MKTTPCKTSKQTGPLGKRFLMACCGAFLILAGDLSAQTWNGVGVSTGGTGTDYGTTANWQNSTVGGDFSSINTAGTYAVTLDSGASLSLSALNFNFSTTGVNLTVGTGTASPDETINLSGYVLVSPEASTVVTLGSDLTLNLGSFSSNRGFEFATSTVDTTSEVAATNPIIYVNALITGTATGTAGLSNQYVTYNSNGGTHAGTPTVVLENNNNTFDAPILNGGILGFTSIGALGVASALGEATSAALGTITTSQSTTLAYIGTSNQTTDRQIDFSGNNAVIANDSSTPTTLTFTTAPVSTNTGTATLLEDYVGSGDTIAYAGNIANGAHATIEVEQIKNTTLVTGAASANGYGTLILSGNNTYTAGTLIAAGNLLVNNTSGSGTGTGAVTIGSYGLTTALGGSGTIAPTGTAGVTVGALGVLYPGEGGTTPTTLTLDGGGTSGTLLTMAASSTFHFNLAAGNTSDEVKFLNFVTGDLVLNINTLNVTGAQAGTYVLFQFYSDSGTTLTASGISSGLTLGTGLTGYTASLDYSSDPGEILLDVAAVPEPSTYALLGLGALCLAGASARTRLRRSGV